MRTLHAYVLSATLGCIMARAEAADLLFDQSPATTGAVFNGVWESDSNGQEQYEEVPFFAGGLLQAIDYFTYNSRVPSAYAQPDFTITGRKDEGGTIADILFSVQSTILSIEPAFAINRRDVSAVHLAFNDVQLPASSFWITISAGLHNFLRIWEHLRESPTETGNSEPFRRVQVIRLLTLVAILL